MRKEDVVLTRFGRDVIRLVPLEYDDETGLPK